MDPTLGPGFSGPGRGSVRAAGAEYCMDEAEIVRNIEDAGFVAKRRNMGYDVLGDPFFRARREGVTFIVS